MLVVETGGMNCHSNWFEYSAHSFCSVPFQTSSL